MIYRKLISSLPVALSVALVLFATRASAVPVTWNEVGEAGDLPGAAQSPIAGDSLVSISGTISTSSDVDMYRIFIPDPSAFFATTVGVTLTFDTQLFLFNSAGIGVMANDDDSGGAGTRSTLPAGTALLTAPGEYFLAISGYNRDPLSPGGLIFPNSPFTGVFGPTGPGGGQPVNGWTGGDPTGIYTINLRGTLAVPEPSTSRKASAIPEPSTMLLLGFGLIALAKKLKRSSRS